MSVDQFEEAKEASQEWKYSNERISESWRKVEAVAMGSSVQNIDRVAVMIDLPLLMQSDVLFSNISEEFPSQICHK